MWPVLLRHQPRAAQPRFRWSWTEQWLVLPATRPRPTAGSLVGKAGSSGLSSIASIQLSGSNRSVQEDRAMARTSVGDNVELEVSADGSQLTICIDLRKDFGPSSSGKSRIIASTKGNADIPGTPGVKLGLNLFRK